MVKKPEEPVFMRLHLRGAGEIAGVFGVKVDTVREWHKKGAPILRIGRKYQANYFDLWRWLKRVEN